MQIRNAVIHELKKAQHQQPSFVVANQSLEATDAVQALVLDIHKLYTSRASKGYGRFEANENAYRTAPLLREMVTGNAPFLQTTHHLMEVLSARASQAPLATGGFVLMAHLEDPGHGEWFIVAILNNVDSAAINENLEVVQSVHVDLNNVRVAGRLNVTDWLGGDSQVRYIGFLKQRGDVADYFKQFLGCNEVMQHKEETKKLINVLKRFASAQALSPEQEETFFSEAYGFALACAANQTPISLDALSNYIWPAEPDELRSALTEADVQIGDSFIPDRGALRKLVRIRAKTKFWTLDLQRKAMSEGYATYHRESGELTLKNLPPELRAELEPEGDG